MKPIEETSIKKIFLMLGSNCNFHCRYCLQESIKENIFSKSIAKELYEYIDKLIEFKQDENQLKVIFWGGEPLLYWNIIKEFVLHYNFLLSYGIISNGSLLNQEIIDFLNKNNISITISHDGPNTIKTRNIDILQNPKIINYLKQLNKYALNSVLSGYNYDFNKLFDYWEKIFPDKSGNIEMLHVTWDMPNDLIDINLNEFRNNLKIFFQDAIERYKNEDIKEKTIMATRYIRNVVNSINKRRYHFPKCHQIERVMNIDLDGNIYACHNCSIKIGNISEDREIYIQRYHDWLETKKKPECETCEAKYFCQGGCPLDIDNSTCILQKILYEEAKNSYENNKEIWDNVI